MVGFGVFQTQFFLRNARLRLMFGHTRDEFRNYQTNVLIEEPPNLLFVGRIFRIIKCTKIKWAGLVTCRSMSE